MKKIVSFFLSMILLVTGCAITHSPVSNVPLGNESVTETTDRNELSTDSIVSDSDVLIDDNVVSVDTTENKNNLNVSFSGLDDPELLSFAEDTIYAEIVRDLEPGFFVDNVEAVYVSKEYIEDLAYNSKTNVYFGYSASELNELFQGKRYIFTLDENGHTIVQEMETVYDDSAQKILDNVVTGNGVILICVTISIASGGLGAPAISMIFAAAATTGTEFAVSSAVIGGAAAAITTGYQTQDFDEALDAGLLAASDGFKWGAISGALAGGGTTASALRGATLNGLTMDEAAVIQNESGYPLDVIKQFKSMDEYNIYKDAGLKATQVGKRSALVRNIDLNYKTTFPNGEKLTNLEAMSKGYAPKYIDPKTRIEHTYQLHHVNQNPDGTLAILKESEHQGNSKILNVFGKESEIDRNAFEPIKRQFWMDFASMVG